jgi:hypothetical protein
VKIGENQWNSEFELQLFFNAIPIYPRNLSRFQFTEFLEEKPNSAFGYYRDYYQKYKDDPLRGSLVADLKPLLDMLEAAKKRHLMK